MPAADSIPLSVVLIAKNSGGTIGRVFNSLRGLGSEIVHVDTGSTDNTMDLARAAGARIVERPWEGMVRTKARAVALAERRWVLQLDSDEPLTPELARSIRELVTSDPADVAAARVRRFVEYRGALLRHAWQPEYRLRMVRTALLRSGAARWAGEDPHDHLAIDDSAGRIATLEGVLIHESFPTFEAHLERQLGYGRIAARSAFARGKRTTPARLVTSPVGAAFKQLVLKSAWRDGPAGWLAAATSAAGALIKHAVLLELGLSEGLTDPEGPAGDPNTYHDAAGADPAGRSRPNPSSSKTPADPGTRPTTPGAQDSSSVTNDDTAPESQTPAIDPETGEPIKKKKKRRRRRKKKTGDAPQTETGAVDAADGADTDAEDADDDRSGRERLKNVTPMSEEAKKHVFNVERTFRDLGLKDDLLRALDDHGWEHPTKIQGELVPVAITGKDILGQAKTGSGKTAAFGLPVLHQAEPGVPFQALILAPTRELAIQIRDDLEELAKYTGLKVVPVYGGQKIQTQAAKLNKGPEIIVGTPGRVMDMNGRGLLPLDKIRFAVLDEVDRMFDIGFRDDIRRILGLCPRKRQTIFVSATISDDIERLARKEMRDPQRLNVTSGSLTVEMVKQHHIPVKPWDKRRMMLHVLQAEEPELTIVFCRMKRTVDQVARFLTDKGIPTLALHGDLSQGQRNETMRKFRKGTLGVLVASDLAARGLDVDGISHVINYDLPDDPDIYVHRIGRTARAGREGIAWSLVTPEQGPQLTQIENLINAEVPSKSYDDFEVRDEPPADWKPEPKPGFQPVVVEGVEEAKSRYELEAPDTSKLRKEELDAKFPGGLVPKKPPKKRIGGKARTRGR